MWEIKPTRGNITYADVVCAIDGRSLAQVADDNRGIVSYEK